MLKIHDAALCLRMAAIWTEDVISVRQEALANQRGVTTTALEAVTVPVTVLKGHKFRCTKA